MNEPTIREVSIHILDIKNDVGHLTNNVVHLSGRMNELVVALQGPVGRPEEGSLTKITNEVRILTADKKKRDADVKFMRNTAIGAAFASIFAFVKSYWPGG